MLRIRVFYINAAVLIFLLVSCSGPVLENGNQILVGITPSPSVLPSSLPETGTDIFQLPECGEHDSGGHIFLLAPNRTGEGDWKNNNDLIVMNGNGCFPRLVLQNVSGSPAWSRDWKRLAIGCDENAFLCILDVSATLVSCTIAGEFDEGECSPVILQKFKLPSEFADAGRLLDSSWAADNSQIIVTGERLWHILTLDDEGIWETIEGEQWASSIDWSPHENLLVSSGLSLTNMDDGSRVQIIEGIAPQWSPSGTSLAFLKASDDETKDQWGLAVFEISDGSWHWLSEPIDKAESDMHIGHASRRLLSWSPDGRYIAVVAKFRGNYDHHLYRLDTETGEAIILTKKLTLADAGYTAPAWGP